MQVDHGQVAEGFGFESTRRKFETSCDRRVRAPAEIGDLPQAAPTGGRSRFVARRVVEVREVDGVDGTAGVVAVNVVLGSTLALDPLLHVARARALARLRQDAGGRMPASDAELGPASRMEPEARASASAKSPPADGRRAAVCSSRPSTPGFERG